MSHEDRKVWAPVPPHVPVAQEDMEVMVAIVAKKVKLAALRSQVAELELELQSAGAAPPVPDAPVVQSLQPPFEHSEYHQHRGNVGPQGLGWQRVPDAAALTTEELKATRAYARDLEVHSVEEVIAGCTDSLRRYGFCCVDHVVPRDMVAAVYHELGEGQQQKLAAMTKEERQRPGPDGQIRGMGFLGPTLQPLFSQFVCHPAVVGIAQTILDSHVRIANSAQRNLDSDDQAPGEELGGYGRPENRGALGREWHTDWPHDLSNTSSIRQPFPDVAMGLSMVWCECATAFLSVSLRFHGADCFAFSAFRSLTEVQPQT